MSATDLGRGSRHFACRHFGRIFLTLAVVVIGAAIAAPGASAATPCIDRTFNVSNTYQPCVRDEQILLNDLWYVNAIGRPNQLLTTDGYYGSHTASAVTSFMGYWDEQDFSPAITTPVTWRVLCLVTGGDYGFPGTYWRAAGCAYYEP